MKQTPLKICRWIAAFVFFFLQAVQVNAASDIGLPRLSIPDAVRTAVENNPEISAAKSRIESSQARITQARSGLVPQINFREVYSHTTNPMWAFGTKLNQEAITLQDFNPARLNDPDPIDNFASVLSLNWSVYDSGQTWYGWRQAKLGSQAAGLALKRVKQQVIARTVKAYAGLLLSQENEAIIRQTLATARSHLKMVQSRYESGFVVKSDLLRARVHIAALEQQQLQAESQVQVAAAFLNAAMGVPIGGRYELISDLTVYAEDKQLLEDWIKQALSERPELQLLENLEDIAQSEVAKSRSARLPSLYLVGNYEWNTEDFSEWGDNYSLGAVVNVNLFTGYRLSAKIVQAKAELKQVSANKAHLERGIRVQTRQAFLWAQSAQKQIQVAEAAVAQAEEALRIVKNRYDSGLFTIVALLDAELALQQARTNRFKSIHDYNVARTDLALAAGVIDEKANQKE